MKTSRGIIVESKHTSRGMLHIVNTRTDNNGNSYEALPNYILIETLEDGTELAPKFRKGTEGWSRLSDVKKTFAWSPVRYNIVQGMKKKKVSGAELAKKMDLRNATIYDYLAGKREMRTDTLEKIMDYLGIKLPV